MAVSAEALKPKELTVDYNVRNYDDITTWMAEVIDGSMRSSFDFVYGGDDLISRDGGQLGIVFENAVEDAQKKATLDPRYRFEHRRRLVELSEYSDILAMVRGETDFNTMVVVSDFPEEVESLGESFGGYNIDRRSAMLRVITINPDGKLTITSQSLDMSNRQALEAVYASLGFTVQPGELLGQRMQLKVHEVFQQNLTDKLMRVYDGSLASQFGGEWFAGRSGQDRRNTMDFALRQTDLINFYLSSSRDNDAKYRLAATVSARFDNRSNYPVYQTSVRVDNIRLAIEMENYARLAIRQGKAFNGCGGTLLADQDNQMSRLGYGDQDKTVEKQEWYGKYKKTGTCVNCKEKTQVGEKSWCRSCIKGHCGSR